MNRSAVVICLIAVASGVAVYAFQQQQNVKPTNDEAPVNPPATYTESAVFAGGCFWCVEAAFEKVPGVVSVESGYTGGRTKNPTYEEVCRGGTGHIEAVQVKYDSRRISYEDLLDIFWRNIDPTDDGGQFADRGESYTTAIFVADDDQQKIAEASKKRIGKSGVFDAPIVTPIRKLKTFYPAEIKHQDFAKKSPAYYERYRRGSGRAGFLEKTWGEQKKFAPKQKFKKPDQAQLKEILTDLQYDVTQNDGTEPPFRNAYWDNHQDGIYVDVVSGEPLFSSHDKFESGTGWPSFTRPLIDDHIVEHKERSWFSTRVEVRSRFGDSHLGHVFPDGPAPTGLRYCINSAALKFIPADELAEQGYPEFEALFKKQQQ